MPTLPRTELRTRLAEVIEASASARARAEAAIGRSEALGLWCQRVCAQSVAGRVTSRRHCTYALVEGVVEGAPVTAVVRRDGAVDGDRALMTRAELVVALADTFDNGRKVASIGVDPLTSVLTLTRACDETTMIQMGTSPPLELRRG